MQLSRHMALANIGRDEVLLACAVVKGHLKDDMARYLQTGRMGTTGLGRQAYRDLYEYHDLQRQSIARSEYERHIQATVNFIKSNPKEVTTA